MRTLRHEFVELIPDELADDTVYISVKFVTIAHLCCCGCGKEVVTPLSPSDWRLTFDGKTISLVPSIGNWSFPCQSHYWIVRNRVRWAEHWSQEEIAAGRAKDAQAKKRYYEGFNQLPVKQATETATHEFLKTEQSKPSIFQRLRRWLFG